MSLPAGTASTHPRISRDASGGPSPSVEGLPRQGRGEASRAHTLRSNVGRRAQSASCPAPDQDMVTTPHSLMCIHAWRGFTEASGGTSPLLRGCPRQRRGPQGRAHALHSNVGRRAQSASCSAPDQDMVTAPQIPMCIHPWRGFTEASGETSPLLRAAPAGAGPEGPRVAQQRATRAERVASRARDKKRAAFRQPFSLSGGEGIVGIHAPAPSALRAPGPAYGCPVLLLQNRRTPSGFSSPASEVSITTTTACIPERWAEKAAQWAAFLSGGEGIVGASMHPPLPRYALQGQPTAVRFCSCRTVEPSGFSSPASEVSITTTTACIPERWPKKPPSGRLFLVWRRGDSNRGAINACLISSQVHSTTLPPLGWSPADRGRASYEEARPATSHSGQRSENFLSACLAGCLQPR